MPRVNPSARKGMRSALENMDKFGSRMGKAVVDYVSPTNAEEKDRRATVPLRKRKPLKSSKRRPDYDSNTGN